jgi:hypothetical protein
MGWAPYFKMLIADKQFVKTSFLFVKISLTLLRNYSIVTFEYQSQNREGVTYMTNHELSKVEIRDLFIKHVWAAVDYWKNERVEDIRAKLSGLAFSVLTLIDGCDADMPAFILAPAPHKDDKEYCRNHGLNWYPAELTDIGGDLHEIWHSLDPQKL